MLKTVWTHKHLGIFTIFFFSLTVIYSHFIFLQPFLFLDLGGDHIWGQLPIVLGIKQHFLENGFNFFSFQIALGDSALSHWNFFLDPFNLILALFETDKIPFIIIYVHITKMILIYFFFYLFLLAHKFEPAISAAGSLFFTFAGYTILWGQFLPWSTGILYFAITLYSIAKALNGGRYLALTFSIFLFCSSSLYFLFMSTFFYIPYLFLQINLRNPIDRKKVFNIIYASIFGVGLSAFLLVPTTMELLSSPRIGSSIIANGLWHDTKTYVAMLLRFFGNHFELGKCQDINSTDFSWSSYYNLACLYAGSLFPFALVSLSKLKNQNLKKFFFVFSILFVLFFILKFMSAVLHGFSEPTFRWNFIYSAFTALVVAQFLSSYQNPTFKISAKLVFFTWLFIMILYCVTFIISLQAFTCASLFSLTVILQNWIYPLFLTLNAIILVWLPKQPSRAIFIFALLSGVEFSLMGRLDNFSRELAPAQMFERGPQKYFNPGSTLLAEISHNDTNFFRAAKSYISTGFNDPMAEGFRGITGYSSLQNSDTLKFLNLIKNSGQINLLSSASPPNWIILPTNRPHILSFLNVKYYLGLNQKDHPFGFKLIRERSGHFLFENEYQFPMGLIYYELGTVDDLTKLPSEEQDLYLLNHLIIERTVSNYTSMQTSKPADAQLKKVVLNDEIQPSGATITKKDYGLELVTLTNDPFILINVRERNYYRSIRIKLTITSSDQNFLQIFWGDVDQNHTEGLSKTWPLEMGTHQYEFDIPIASSLGTLRFDFGNKIANFRIQHFTVFGEVGKSPELLFLKNWHKIRERFVDLAWEKPGKFFGNVMFQKEGYLVLQIPYSKGWHAKVDNKNVEILKAQHGLLGLNLSAGEHKVEVSFQQPGFFWGVMISSFFVILGSTLLAIRFARKKGFGCRRQVNDVANSITKFFCF